MPVRLLKFRASLLLLAMLSANVALADHREGHVDVTVAALSKMGETGQRAFNQTCAECHGENGAGTMKGPPLVHQIYNPGHHNDKSIYNAMRNGVRQHHWPYGDMPKQASVGFMESTAIVKFIREMQEANGIVYQQHR
ncbi:cytochrome c [Marinobacterium sp. D7]|uniref:c-type cytochrome n=1 Tax=Marinobacterium ramblicola TaxID=2849041 RepID=UPI001C2CD832|nr:cytochrome c [Marinobacterium ramblicola]MBV1788083.1 cytochrome c [Marinobacterium ramblicola]